MKMNYLRNSSSDSKARWRFRRRMLATALMFTFLVIPTRPAHAQGSARDRAVISLVKKIKVKCYSVYEDSFNLSHGDLTENGEPETVVVVTYENSCGGNMYYQQMFVYSPLDSKASKWKLLAQTGIGGKFGPSIEHVYVDDGNIVVTGMQLAEDDPFCCPSVPYVETLTIVKKGSRWIFVKAL